jgi:ABC-type oligopeptide transport system substrate-binding subunit
MSSMMMRRMFSKTIAILALLTAGLLAGCGTSSPGLTGSKHQTMTGVSESGYPGGQPKDAEAPALASTTEQEHSNPGPKVPVE